MPHRKDSNSSATKKRCQPRGEDQGLGDAQATSAVEGVSPSSALPMSGCPPPTPRAAGTAQCSQIARATSSPAATISCTSAGEGACSTGEGIPSASQAVPPWERAGIHPVTWSVGLMIRALLKKYKMRMCIREAEMMSIIPSNFRKHFPEILRRATDCTEMVFGLDLIKIYHTNDSYVLVGKLDFPKDGSLSGDPSFPKDGILMLLLGFICLNDNCITEEKMWKFLNAMGIYAGRRHFIMGEPRKFITKDLVQLRYLEHRQVPNSNPPRYEFLWGPRTHAETTKLEVIHFWSKAHHRVGCAFHARYHQALRIEQERAWARAAARTYSRFISRRSSKPW